MLEREQYEKELKEAQSEDEDGGETLEVFDDAARSASASSQSPPPRNVKGNQLKGKAAASSQITSSHGVETVFGSSKRRRPAIDPFAGTLTISSISIRSWLHNVSRVRRCYSSVSASDRGIKLHGKET